MFDDHLHLYVLLKNAVQSHNNQPFPSEKKPQYTNSRDRLER